jgi:type IV pilus assembly protein PilV
MVMNFTSRVRLPSKRAQNGMTLIESLVALVILALGVLGLIGFQLQTLKDTRDSVGRSRALVAIQDISERMRLNSTAALPDAPAVPLYNDVTFSPPGAAPVPFCVGTACNSAQLAAFDIWRWKSNLRQSLPGGLGLIAPSATDRRQFLVMVAWRENQNDTADAARANPLQDATQTLQVDGGLNNLVCPPTYTCHRAYVQPFN